MAVLRYGRRPGGYLGGGFTGRGEDIWVAVLRAAAGVEDIWVAVLRAVAEDVGWLFYGRSP